MATVSTPNLTFASSTPHSPSPPLKGIKKILSGRRRSSEVPNDNEPSIRQSLDSFTIDRSSTTPSARSSPSRDESSRSGHNSSVHKLIPGHSKRQRRKEREEELKAVTQEPVERGRTSETTTLPPPGALGPNRSTSSLLTDGSDYDSPPPLVTRKSHTGYFTTSSPLISSKTVGEESAHVNSTTSLSATRSTETFPLIVEPDQSNGGDVSPRSPTLQFGSTPVLPSPTLVDRADTLGVDKPGRRGSISKLRGKSPVRKFRDVFSRSSKSPRTSPERESVNSAFAADAGLPGQATIAERRLFDNSYKSLPTPLQTSSITTEPFVSSPKRNLELETSIPAPSTPPSGLLTTPLTTVTPPTPTDGNRNTIVASPKIDEDIDSQENTDSDRASNAPAGTLTHRRVRSASSATHPKSKLSTSMTMPLTPTIEEGNKTPGEKPAGGRNFTAGSGFFSSWVSAAQNAASSIGSLTGQNRSRAGTSNSEPIKSKAVESQEAMTSQPEGQEPIKKQLAVETLGSGNLDFSQLGLDVSADDKTSSLGRSDLAGLMKKSDLQRDAAQAKFEDILAKRAVSAAYEETSESTPVAEISDPLGNLKPSQNSDLTTTDTLTPSGNAIDGENQPVKRSNSVRSKLANRRSRGSSVATGQSTIGATIGVSTSAISNPPTGTRIPGFTPAPKQRNRGFHQQFRSVPEDDNLIEDYSCALQKEILLAGRIYISEGHICFSSNILGWVTTLIISFEEIVSIERENTAMIIPNAIAIQTLHARHTFRSLLSREATFDLIIGIWKVNHPASFSKSVNGKQMIAEQARHDVEAATGNKAGDEGGSAASSNEDSGSDDDEDDDDSHHSVSGSNASVAGSEPLDVKSVTRKPSGSNGVAATTNGASSNVIGDVAATAAVVAGVPGATTDFPGPVMHAPTDCTDGTTHYDKVIKDEIIPAPLGKIYSLMYGPQSGVFLRKYLVDECKSLELALEDDKKGLTNDNKVRQYSYIKPLGGSIGPKQTKCITTENLDFFDLDKSVSVTCTTQTPDVPSGGAFATKTRYCLSWAPGNATRLQMNCTIEWSAKSWLKGPIEKGANDGQQQYGDGLVKALKAALGRSRGGTTGSKGAKTKKKKKGERRAKSEQTERTIQQNKNWGVFEPLRPTLGPVLDIVRPVMKLEIIVSLLAVMVIILWFGGRDGKSRQLTYHGMPHGRIERLAAYEQLWQKEESDLWDWLEDRAGVHRGVLGRTAGSTGDSASRSRISSKNRPQGLKDKSMAARLQAEKWSKSEMQEAVRVTREKLDEMQRALDERVV